MRATALAQWFVRMEASTKATGRTTDRAGLGVSSRQMAPTTRAAGLLGAEMDSALTAWARLSTEGSGNRTTSMGRGSRSSKTAASSTARSARAAKKGAVFSN